MSSQYNRTTIQGNVVADPEVHTFNDGGRKISFTIANNESWKDRETNEWKNKAFFIDIVLQRKGEDGLTKMVEAHVKKGQPLIVDGKLYTEEWTDKKTNEKRSRIRLRLDNIVMLERKEARDEKPKEEKKYVPPKPQNNDSDDVPF